MSDLVTVAAGRAPGGSLVPPGDKSISHRAVLLAAMATGRSRLSGFLESEDCRNTLTAITHLGAEVERDGDGSPLITGCGGRWRTPEGELDLGNSGTGLRLLAGCLAPFAGPFVLTGDDSLRRRPMERIAAPLRLMGAGVTTAGRKGTPPLRIDGCNLRACRHQLDVASAQVKSCILLAGLYARGNTEVLEPGPSRDHTERMLRACGADIHCSPGRVVLAGYGPAGPGWEGREWSIPGDFSSAAFFMAGAALTPGCEVVIEKVGLNPLRSAFLNVLRDMGADVMVESADTADEPRGTVRVTGRELRAVTVGGSDIPKLIDELPLVALLAGRAHGTTVIRDAGELRFKESDRIATMAAALRQLGVAVRETVGGMEIVGRETYCPRGVLDAAGDHRIAMALAVGASVSAAPLKIRRAAGIATSYPGFWQDFVALGGAVTDG